MKLNHQFHVLLDLLEIVVILILHLTVRHHPDKLVLSRRFFGVLYQHIEIFLGFVEEGLNYCVCVYNDHEFFVDLCRFEGVFI